MKLRVNPISQNTDSWKELKLGNSKLRIGDNGSYLVSLCMFLSNYKMVFNPVNLNEVLKRMKGFNNNLIISKNVAKHFNMTFKQTVDKTHSEYLSIIRQRLIKGHPTIIKVSKVNHFVIATDFKTKENDVKRSVFIIDPNNGKSCVYETVREKYGNISSLRLYTPKPYAKSGGILGSKLDLNNKLKNANKQINKMEKEIKVLSRKVTEMGKN